MAGYFDSSLLLAAVLRQGDSEELARHWDGESIRVSSVLTRLECVVALRRLATGQGETPESPWVADRLAALEPYFRAMTIHYVDATIEETLCAEPRLAGCRTLDAAHLATALAIQPHLDEPLRLYSLDKRMRTVAHRVGLTVRP